MKMNQKEILLKVWKYIKGYRGRLGLSIALASLSVILTLYAPVLVGAAIDYIV